MSRAIPAVLALGLCLAVGQPLQNRVLIARSADGLAWQRTGTILCDSADVPEALRGPDGRFHVYYQGLWDPYHDGIMVAVSEDGLSGWERHQVSIPGTESWPGRPCDPDIILFDDTFRLYFTGDPLGDGFPETHSAVSLDGWNFALEAGTRFEVTSRMVLDPSLLRTGDTLQYFAGGAAPGANWHAHSTDGLDFARQADVAVDSLMLSNGVALDSGYRFYGFKNMLPCGIKSVFSADGGLWTLEPGWRLQLDSTGNLEYSYVKDAAVVGTDSGFIMYYVTRKREAALNDVGETGDRWPKPVPTIAGGMLRLPTDPSTSSSPGRLLDISGRAVLLLKPGANDVSRLSPGVYFVRERLAASGERSAVSIRKVVVTR